MSDFSPRARSILDDARAADDPTTADRERVGRALAASLGVAPLVPATVQAASATGMSVGGASIKFAVVLALVALGAGVAWQRHLRRPSHTHPQPLAASASWVRERPLVAPPAPVAPVLATPSPTAASLPAPALPVVPVRTDGPVRIDTPHRARSAFGFRNSLAREIALLGEAQSAVRQGDAMQALSRLDAYHARFPHGQMQQDAIVMRVLAMCQLGRRAEALHLARHALHMAHESPLEARVSTACSVEPGSNSSPRDPSPGTHSPIIRSERNSLRE